MSWLHATELHPNPVEVHANDESEVCHKLRDALLRHVGVLLNSRALRLTRIWQLSLMDGAGFSKHSLLQARTRE